MGDVVPIKPKDDRTVVLKVLDGNVHTVPLAFFHAVVRGEFKLSDAGPEVERAVVRDWLVSMGVET